MCFGSSARYKLRVGIVILVTGFLGVNSLSGWATQIANSIFEKQYFLKESEVDGFVIHHSGDSQKKTPVTWIYIKPVALDYDNTRHCSSGKLCIAKIQYLEEEIASTKDAQFVLSDSAIFNGPGTYFIVAKDRSGEKRYRVSIRRSDDYIGYISELFGVPFVYAPKYIEGEGHQTDNGIGADCIAAVIYGKRRAGEAVPYFAPPKLYDLTHKIGDSGGIQKASIRQGDVLHFGFQTAVLSQDTKPLGVLNPEDRVIHSYHRYVEEVSFAELPYGTMPFDILRWK